MFSLLLALTLSLVLSPFRPTLSARDFVVAPPPVRPLPTAATRPLAAPARKDQARLGVELKSRSAAVLDWRTGVMLFGQDADSPQPIASLTKLMTAIVSVEQGLDPARTVQIWGSDMRPGGVPYVAPAEEVTIENLLNLALVASSNESAVALARASGLSPEEFVAKMNETAQRLGMANTVFMDPSGLDMGNVASARDVAAMLRHALASPTIREIVTKREYAFEAKTGRPHAVRSTDDLLGSFLSKPPYKFLGGKTGFIEESGYCFGAAAENGDGHRLIAVVLGAPTKEVRFNEVKGLLFWAFDAFEWPQ